MTDKKLMIKEDTARIQSFKDKTGTNQKFKAMTQRVIIKSCVDDYDGFEDYLFATCTAHS